MRIVNLVKVPWGAFWFAPQVPVCPGHTTVGLNHVAVARSNRQWAAVSTCLGPTNVPEQMCCCPAPLCKAAIALAGKGIVLATKVLPSPPIRILFSSDSAGPNGKLLPGVVDFPFIILLTLASNLAAVSV